MNTKFGMCTALVLALLSAGANAKEYTVKELNSGTGGQYVFEPSYLHIQPGDSVHFVAVNTGHQSHAYLVPQGAKGWTAEMSKDITVKFTQQGVYLYDCIPHHMLGMLGVIQVGKAVNLAAAQKAATGMEQQQIMNQGRLEALMKDIH